MIYLLAFALVSMASAQLNITTCLECPDQCAVLSDHVLYELCYGGNGADVQVALENDPLLCHSSPLCSDCAGIGFPNYLSDDPQYDGVKLYTQDRHEFAEFEKPQVTSCLECSSVCSMISGQDICYEGTPEDGQDCLENDILVRKATPHCVTCDSIGYSKYLRNDPIYTTMELWIDAAARNVAKQVQPPQASSCLECTDTCAMIATSIDLCYQSNPTYGQYTLENDIILRNAVPQCTTCSALGYTCYIGNDPVYTHTELWSDGKKAEEVVEVTSCLECSSVCSMISGQDICYEGTPEDGQDCLENDILVRKATPHCVTCDSIGYSNYLRNDPIYTTMGLWNN